MLFYVEIMLSVMLSSGARSHVEQYLIVPHEFCAGGETNVAEAFNAFDVLLEIIFDRSTVSCHHTAQGKYRVGQRFSFG